MRESRLTQARGLKPIWEYHIALHVMSRLTQARGLKLTQYAGQPEAIKVAPHAGAWIETRQPCTPCI